MNLGGCNDESFNGTCLVKIAERDEREDLVTDISQLYQIFPDDVLGSGQFGIVYGGELNVESIFFRFYVFCKVVQSC